MPELEKVVSFIHHACGYDLVSIRRAATYTYTHGMQENDWMAAILKNLIRSIVRVF